MNYFEFYPGDYARDTRQCSLAEHGAFLLLLSAYYSTERPLPADHGTLCRMCSAMTAEEQAAVKAVAEAFFPTCDDGLRHNARADAEIAKAQNRIRRARENGARGGRPKKPSGNPVGSYPGNRNETQPLTQTITQTITGQKALHTPYTKQEQDQEQDPPSEIAAGPEPGDSPRPASARGRRSAPPLDLPAWLDVSAWEDWCRFRASRKGWTAHAKALSLRTLTSLHAQGHQPRAVIEQSIERGWTGLFPVKDHPHANGSSSAGPLSAVERVRATIEARIHAESAAAQPVIGSR